MQRMSFYQNTNSIRLKKASTSPLIDGEADVFTACRHSSQLVVRNNHDGQESYMLCTYRDILELEPTRGSAGVVVVDNSFKEDALATTAATFSPRVGSLEEGELLYTAGAGAGASNFDNGSSVVDTTTFSPRVGSLEEGELLYTAGAGAGASNFDNGISVVDTKEVIEFWKIIEGIGADEV
eukprot:CAMPEP_0171986492 /NCGR_PEP_ID=MMETSP0993-20121228/274899_1 /TAXON_ID=483369 /ORGANISM="non described non described, Strain CCMP2098" /LENGTH=180 /DNA_ID=CAMNT_0012639399 /DNA_START=14 /DNA_END=556 /DNA_ORIENTATION=-